MPTSHPEALRLVTEILADNPLKADTVIDVGPGSGTYSGLIRDIFPAAESVAIEKWAPYIESYELDAIYDQVIVADAAWFDWSVVEGPFGVIFGDVLEHMRYGDARRCWNNARSHASWVIASIPLGEYPQDEVEGNPYERHKSTWGVMDAYRLGGVNKHLIGDVVGVFLASGK